MRDAGAPLDVKLPSEQEDYAQPLTRNADAHITAETQPLEVPSALPSPRGAPSPAASPPPLSLLSTGRPAKADVRGNLAAPTVITDESTADWLADRWQAAANMQGEPIPGPHWVEVDLERVAEVRSMLLDWETAHATDWSLRTRVAVEDAWQDAEVQAREVSRGEQHVVQDAQLVSVVQARFLRLTINAPATQWGASLWRWQVWGREVVRGGI